MRKVPSCAKISSKTNITMTQHLSINSPKAALSQKKLFKNTKSGVEKINDNRQNNTNTRQNNSKSKLTYYAPKSSIGPRRQSSGNLTKPQIN